MAKADLTAARLREAVHYDPETGIFRNLKWRGGPTNPGTIAGFFDVRGRQSLSVYGCSYRASRLAWLYVTGEWPKECIDHINGDHFDNRFANLRDVPHKANMQNIHKANVTNRSGLLGAHQIRSGWRAVIYINGRTKHLGVFRSPEAAHEAYMVAKREHHEGFTLPSGAK